MDSWPDLDHEDAAPKRPIADDGNLDSRAPRPVPAELPTVAFSTPAIEGISVPMDCEVMEWLWLLARARLREYTERRAGMPAATWEFQSDDLVGAAVVATPDQSLDVLVKQVRAGPLITRLLFAIYARMLAARHITLNLEESWLGRMLWGAQKPRNWRTQLRTLMTAAAALRRLHQVQGQHNPAAASVIARIQPVRGGWTVTLGRGLLGSLYQMVQADESLHIVDKRPSPNARITQADMDAERQIRCSDTEVSDRDLRRIIRDVRAREADAPSLQNIGRRGLLWNLFLPSVLGEPQMCQEMGRLTAVLFRERTRTKPVEKALVPAYASQTQIACPRLNPDLTYEALNGNCQRRRAGKTGRSISLTGWGYAPGDWASRVGSIDTDEFLRTLALAETRLGLIAAGLDPDGRWHSVAELQAMNPAERHRIRLRVYTEMDYVARWTRCLGWQSPSPSPAQADAVSPTGVPDEIAQLGAIVRDRGLRKVAAEAGIHPSVLSLVLNRKRKARPELLARLRTHLRGTQPLGGGGTGSVFEGCTTLLDFALAYRRLGWSVVPMVPPGKAEGRKKPLIHTKPFFAALPSEHEIRDWWRKWPDAGIGMILGPVSGVLAIDVDGQEAYEVLLQRLGGEPRAPKAMSGSGDPHRMHFFFQHPDLKTKAKVTPWHPKLEFRGQGGLIVLAPSPHKSGNIYCWAEGQGIEEIALPEVPAEVLLGLQPTDPPEATVEPAAPVRRCAELDGMRLSQNTADFLAGRYATARGERNGRLFNAACELKARRVAYNTAERVLLAGLQLENEGHRAECLATIRSAYAQERTLMGR